MSYVLCNINDCKHHDGAGCTLETVELEKPLVKIDMFHYGKAVKDSGSVTPLITPDIAACRDYEPVLPYR